MCIQVVLYRVQWGMIGNLGGCGDIGLVPVAERRAQEGKNGVGGSQWRKDE